MNVTSMRNIDVRFSRLDILYNENSLENDNWSIIVYNRGFELTKALLPIAGFRIALGTDAAAV